VMTRRRRRQRKRPSRGNTAPASRCTCQSYIGARSIRRHIAERHRPTDHPQTDRRSLTCMPRLHGKHAISRRLNVGDVYDCTAPLHCWPELNRACQRLQFWWRPSACVPSASSSVLERPDIRIEVSHCNNRPLAAGSRISTTAVSDK